MNKQTQFTMGALLLIVIAIVVVIYNEQESNEPSEKANKNASLLIRDYSRSVGNKNAKGTMVEVTQPA